MNLKYTSDFVSFVKGDQKRFLKLSKEQLGVTWDCLAAYLQVNRSMIFQYFSEKSKLPLIHFETLIFLSDVNVEDFSYQIFSYLDKGVAQIPYSIDSKLAEFVGILLGDGNIHATNYQITISCGIIDGEYISKYIPLLVFDLFSKHVSFRKQSRGGIDCRFSSKKVVLYLQEMFFLKFPKKNMVIPELFFEDNSLLKACVRGLFDTDGGLHKHHTYSAQLHFTNNNLTLLHSLRRALIQLKFNPSNITVNHKEKGTYMLYLFSKDVRTYFSLIGSHNPKNSLKFERWVLNGIVPNNSEIKNIVVLTDLEQEMLLGKKINQLDFVGYSKVT